MSEDKTQDRKSVKIAISLFDPKNDHWNVKNASGKANRRNSTSVAFAKENVLCGANHFLLIHEKEYAKTARGIVGTIESGMKSTRETILKHQSRNRHKTEVNEQEQPNGIPQPSVTAIEAAYEDVWDLENCLSAIDTTLKQYETIFKAASRATLLINLSNGTFAQRTALGLWAIRQARGEHPNCRCRFATAREDSSFAFTGENDTSFHFLQTGIETGNRRFHDILDMLERLTNRIHDNKAQRDPILITGDTGSGKSRIVNLIITYLKQLDPKNKTDANCISQNITAIAPTLIENELFGHEKDAFTGATDQKKGLFEQANGGILFLDEIGEMPMELQPKILTVLDSGKFRRLGGSEVVKSNFLLICGTNKDLEAQIAAGKFRRDLYERINVWSFHLPSLKERLQADGATSGNDPRKDCEANIAYERGRWKQETGVAVTFDADAKETFVRYALRAEWKGNFREFHAFFRHLAMFPSGNNHTITKQDVEKEISRRTGDTEMSAPECTDDENLFLRLVPEASQANINAILLVQVRKAIEVCARAKNQAVAARELFNATYAALNLGGKKFNEAQQMNRFFNQRDLRTLGLSFNSIKNAAVELGYRNNARRGTDTSPQDSTAPST